MMWRVYGGWKRDCRRMARRMAVHAVLAVAAVATGLAALAISGSGLASIGEPAMIVAALLGVAVLAAAGHVALDAWLFAVMARHDDEESGGAAVDRLLSRLRLAPARDTVRPAAARIAGARGVLRRLWLALAAFVAATAFAATLPFAARG